ncbi:hypothetical protein cypCar_00024891, partial [Cyprinus carpio]
LPDIRVSRPILIPGFPENATVLVGGHVKLVCKLHKPVSTRLQWFKKDSNHLGPDGSPLLTVLTPLLENLSKVNILPLVNVSVEDAGEYVCKAENSVGQTTRSAWVKVLSDVSEEPTEETSEHLVLELGDVLKLRCDTNRPGTVQWFKGGVRVQHNARIQIRAAVMEIADVTYEDSGVYLCVLRGTKEALRNFAITVTDAAGSGDDDEDNGLDDAGPETENDQVYISRAPYWTHTQRMEKKLYAVPAGNTVKFRCPATGSPLPTIRWLKNGREFRGEHRIGGIKLRHQHWSLVMESVVPSDRGNYSCVLENKYGSIAHTYLLDVLERSPHRPILQAGLPKNTTAVVGGDAQFLCKVYSDAQPHIQWLKHIEMNGSRYGPDGIPYVKIVKTGSLNMSEVEVLYLTNITMEDAGEYTCLAGNSIGFSHQSAWLTVLSEEDVAKEMDLMEAKYTDIIIYASGFLALVMAIVIVVLCRMQVHPSQEPFDTLPVQKLSKFPLRRQYLDLSTPFEQYSPSCEDTSSSCSSDNDSVFTHDAMSTDPCLIGYHDVRSRMDLKTTMR